MAIIGLDIGGTKLLGAIFDKKGNIIDKEKNPSKGEEGLNTLLDQIHKTIDSLVERSETKLKGIGVGVPGIVSKKGKIIFTANLPFGEFKLSEHLEEKYNVPVRIGNDVNLGVFGEYSELEVKEKNVIGLFPGTGLGGGIILDGKLYIGKGFAGEIGHITVQKDGHLCGCGNHGCLETFASKKGIIAYLKQEMSKGRDTVMKEAVESGVIKSSKLKKAYDKGDVLVVEAMNQFKEYLGMGCGIIMNIFNPNRIIIGGGIIDAFGDTMLEDVRLYAERYSMPGVNKYTKIKASKLGDDAVIYGAYHLIKSIYKA